MKKMLSKLALALSAIACSWGIHAQTVTDTNVTITGTFTAVCSISGNNLALGSADLPTYIDATLVGYNHVRFPVSLGISCNSESVPWRMYNITPAGVPLTIGATTDNTACIAAADQVGDGYHKCADNVATPYHGGAYITGTGSVTKPVLLLIWHTVGGVNLPYKGSGAISAVIPMRMEY